MTQPSQIDIVTLQPPLSQTDELVELLRHKGPPWIDDIRARLQGKRPGSLDRCFVARLDRSVVGHVWYTVAAADRRVGLLGHVFTLPEFRRQGIAARLVETAMDDFRRDGGQIMQLYASETIALPLYERFGFEQVYANRVLHEMDWYMRYPAGAQAALQDWFSPGPWTMREVSAGDLPKYCLLYGLEFDTLLKDWAQGIGLGPECELRFITLLDRLSQGLGVAYVLENGQTIVGMASLLRCEFSHQSHLGAVDCYVHPGYQDGVRPLVEAALAAGRRLGIEIVYALAVDEPKRRTFAELGLTHVATLRRHYQIQAERFDCAVFRAGTE